MKKEEFLQYVKDCVDEAIAQSIDTLNGHRLSSMVESIPHNGVQVVLTYPCKTPQGTKYIEASAPMSLYAIEDAENVRKKVYQLCTS